MRISNSVVQPLRAASARSARLNSSAEQLVERDGGHDGDVERDHGTEPAFRPSKRQCALFVS